MPEAKPESPAAEPVEVLKADVQALQQDVAEFASAADSIAAENQRLAARLSAQQTEQVRVAAETTKLSASVRSMRTTLREAVLKLRPRPNTIATILSMVMVPLVLAGYLAGSHPQQAVQEVPNFLQRSTV